LIMVTIPFAVADSTRPVRLPVVRISEDLEDFEKELKTVRLQKEIPLPGRFCMKIPDSPETASLPGTCFTFPPHSPQLTANPLADFLWNQCSS